MRGRKKLSIWSALPPYLGGKRRLCPIIFRELDKVLPRRHWPGMTFVDAFLGGGSVSLYAKAMGLKVFSMDIAERSIIVGKALIENSRVQLTREDILKIASLGDESPSQIEQKYAPKVFTRQQARFLDRAFHAASTASDPAKAALYRLLAMRVALKAHPMSQVRAGTINKFESGEVETISEKCVSSYVDGMRLTRPEKLWDLAQQINAGIFQGEGQVLKGDVSELLPQIEADIVYFDPPYPGTIPHEREYKVLDEIFEGLSHPVSQFNRKDGTALVDDLLKQAAHIPIWILSFGNAVAGIQDLEAKMQTFGRSTHAIAVKYAHKESVASETKKALNQEFVVVGWDAERVQARVAMGADQMASKGFDAMGITT